MDADARAEIARELARIEDLIRERTRNIPSQPAEPAGTMRLQIVGGQTTLGVPMIEYQPGPIAPPKLYVATVDTSYISGLGYATLWVDGVDMGLVLARHDYSGYPDPAMAGQTFPVRGTAIETVASGADAGVTMLVYTFWLG